MAITPNMQLNLPVPTVTLGPAWASQLNTALGLVDDHDHTTNKGRKVPSAGLNINADLSFNSFNLNLVRSVRFTAEPTPLVEASDIRSVYSAGGDLYYNNSAGVAVQITSGSSVLAASDGISRAFENLVLSTATLTIGPSDTFSFIEADGTAGNTTITLPSAAAVAAGRLYEFKNSASIDPLEAVKTLTLNPNGSDTVDGVAGDIIVGNNGTSVRLVSDGIGNWLSNRTFSSFPLASASSGNYSQNFAIPNSYAVTNLSVTITTKGRPVVIKVIPDGQGTSANTLQSEFVIFTTVADVMNDLAPYAQINRDSTNIFMTSVPAYPSGLATTTSPRIAPTFIETVDYPAAGTYTYTVRLGNRAGASLTIATAYLKYAKLIAYEV